MNASEHIAQALIHLDAAANAGFNHLLREQRHTEWNREVLASARASAARDLLTEVHAVWALSRRNHGQFLISDSHEMTSDSSWWTESQS